MIAGDDDVLDFSLFGVPITLDLGSAAQQNVGGGLFLTLSGLFRQAIGTAFNDLITGSSADNTIYGGGGDDTLLGGGGSDSLYGGDGNDSVDGGSESDLLHGGDGIDTVVNFEAQDAHISIEIGLPRSGKSGHGNGSKATTSSTLYRVESAELVRLSCGTTKNILRLSDGDQVSFWNLCQYDASLTVPADADPNSALLGTWLSALDVEVFDGDLSLSSLPAGSALAVSFVLPEGLAVERVALMFWDAEREIWRELPWKHETGCLSVPLNPDDSTDGRWVLTGVSLVEGGRLTAKVNFTGLFALVAK